MDSRALDRYITREPPEPEEPPVCGECGEELPVQAIERTEHRHYRWCNGKPSVVECEHDDAVLAIIGEEFRGQSFETAYAAECGTRDGGGEYGGETEISSVLAVEAWTHDPHWFEEPMGPTETLYRFCSKGHKNAETVM